MSEPVLVAGVGNVFRSDDGFGVAVLRQLVGHGPPAGVELMDVGIRGMHLAYQLLEGYSGLVLVDAISRGGSPGELYLLEHDLTGDSPLGAGERPVPDAHDMSPETVLALLAALATASGLPPTAGLRRVLLVGCEPASIAEGIGLSEPVEASLEPASTAVIRAATDLAAESLPWRRPVNIRRGKDPCAWGFPVSSLS